MFFDLRKKKGENSLLHCPVTACRARAFETIHTGVTKEARVIAGCYSFHSPVVCEVPTPIPTHTPDFL